MRIKRKTATAGLTVLIVLQIVMLSALFAGVPPHPPQATPLFGIGPFIGASVSLAIAAIVMGADTSVAGRILALLATLAALVSFGPQKYVDAQFGMIWPAVITAQGAIIAIIVAVATNKRSPNTNTASGDLAG